MGGPQSPLGDEIYPWAIFPVRLTRVLRSLHLQDFSAGDLKLALNAGIPFQTPEQFFMGSAQSLHKNR